MEDRRSGRGRRYKFRQPLNEENNHKPVPEQNRKLGVDPNAQVATAIQHMTDLLT
mgnify:CR=1 FL=1